MINNEPITTAGEYDKDFLMHFTHLLTFEMSKVSSPLVDEERLEFRRERINDCMILDLPRLKYYVDGELVSVPGDTEKSLLNLQKLLLKNHCIWFIQYLEELSSILHQGIMRSIYEAKKLTANPSWHHKYNLNIELLTHATGGNGVAFCILPEKKIVIAVASSISNILMGGGVMVVTDSSKSRFETSIFINFLPVPASNNYGSKLIAQRSETETMGYSMHLYPL